MKTSINFLELSQEILGRGSYLRFQARGYSMYPAIRDGEFILVKPAKPTEIKLGDVVFYRTANEKVVVHRVIKRYIQNHKMLFLTKGDSMPASEQIIYPEDIIGKIVAVERDGKKIRLDKNLTRLISLFQAKFLTQSIWIYPLLRKLKQRILSPCRF